MRSGESVSIGKERGKGLGDGRARGRQRSRRVAVALGCPAPFAPLSNIKHANHLFLRGKICSGGEESYRTCLRFGLESSAASCNNIFSETFARYKAGTFLPGAGEALVSPRPPLNRGGRAVLFLSAVFRRSRPRFGKVHQNAWSNRRQRDRALSRSSQVQRRTETSERTGSEQKRAFLFSFSSVLLKRRDASKLIGDVALPP